MDFRFSHAQAICRERAPYWARCWWCRAPGRCCSTTERRCGATIRMTMRWKPPSHNYNELNGHLRLRRLVHREWVIMTGLHNKMHVMVSENTHTLFGLCFYWSVRTCLFWFELESIPRRRKWKIFLNVNIIPVYLYIPTHLHIWICFLGGVELESIPRRRKPRIFLNVNIITKVGLIISYLLPKSLGWSNVMIKR